MEYQEARYIRNMPSLSDLIRREAVYGGQGAVGAVKEALKQKLNVKRRLHAKIVGIKEKFDPMYWAKAMFGKTGAALYGRAFNRSDEDMQYFAGRARPLGGRSYQIGEVPKYRGYEPEKSKKVEKIRETEDSGKVLLPTLTKMYDFLKKTKERETLERELLNNKREENQQENERRHKELIKTIKAIKITPSGKEVKEKKEEKTGGMFDFLGDLKNTMKEMLKGMIDDALKAYEWLKELKILTKLVEFVPKILSVMGWFTGTALGAALLGIATPLALLAFLGKSQKEEIESNPYDPKFKDNAYAKTLRGEAKSVKQATQQNIAQAVKTFRRNEVEDFVKSDQTDAELMEQFGKDRKGLKKWLVENPKPGSIYQAPVRGMGPTAGSSVPEMPDQTDAETARLKRQAAQKTTTIPPKAEPVAPPVPKAEPVAPPVKDAVSNLSQRNSQMKLEAKHSAPEEQVINNKVVNTTKNMEDPKLKLPSIRNHEESFERMIFESTRLV